MIKYFYQLYHDLEKYTGMNIENILSFVNVHKYNGFRRAAEAMYLTQPSLTSRIHTLERELGVSLLERTHNGVELTEAGEIFLPYALQIVNAYTQAKGQLRTGKSRLVIGTNISISISMLPHVIKALHRRRSGVSVEIVTNMPDALLELLRREECDFLITQSYGLPDLTETPVYQDKISLIVPPDHPLLARGMPPDFSQVALEPIICSSAMSNYWESIESHFRARGVEPNVVLSVDSVEIAKNMVLQGLGIAFLPELALEKELIDGSLVSISPVPELKTYRNISLIHLPWKEPPYRDIFTEACQQYKSWSSRV